MMRSAKNCDRSRWLPEQIRAIARSTQNFASIARDRSCVKFPFRSKRIASKFFARLSLSRNKFITFTWPHTSYLPEPFSVERFISRRENYGFQARVYRSCSQSKFSTQQNRSQPEQVDSPALSATKLSAVTSEIPPIHPR